MVSDSGISRVRKSETVADLDNVFTCIRPRLLESGGENVIDGLPVRAWQSGESNLPRQPLFWITDPQDGMRDAERIRAGKAYDAQSATPWRS